MQNSDGRTRRQAIQIGAAAASVAVVGATVGSTAAGASPADWGAVGRVRSVSEGVVELDLLAGPEGTAARKVVGRVSVPFIGFPESVTPRAGDKVAISTTTPGYEAAALPLTHWVTGIPRATGDGSFTVNGERAIDAAPLRAADQAGAPVEICLLDTDLPAAQVLHVRPAEHR